MRLSQGHCHARNTATTPLIAFSGLPPACPLVHPPSTAAKEQAEADARRETVASTLAEKERRLAEARAELDKAQKETRHVDSQASSTVQYMQYRITLSRCRFAVV